MSTDLLLPPLSRDVRTAARTLGRSEARYLVDLYYQFQDQRKALHNQDRALGESEEPHETIAHFAGQMDTIEAQVKSALDAYSAADPLGAWARSIIGIGPVIAAGLLAHIDIARTETAGGIWRFAGLDPTSTWGKGERRPWNAQLKVLAWKIGDSFVKQSGHDGCVYGHLYLERKRLEVQRDEAGGNAATAAKTLAERTFRDTATRKVYEDGHLPAGRLDLRARRWAVKLFLAHYHAVGYELLHGRPPSDPYSITQLGHAHKLSPPNWPPSS